jgi:hypothetical protein
MRRGLCIVFVNLACRSLLALFLLAGCSAPERTLVGPKGRATSPWFAAITNLSSFHVTAQRAGLESVLTSPVLSTPLAWDELVISWNGSFPAGTGLTVEARAVGAGHGNRYFVLGRWAADRAVQPRESVSGQNDSEGEVRTDTLSLKSVATGLQLRLTLTASSGSNERAQVRFLGLSFLDRSAPVVALASSPLRAAWGRELAVPGRSQLSYQGGRDWCSPTSVSMVLAYWAERLKRPELDREVPEVAQGVFDPAWPGTGNWPFNTAFAGQFAGMRAYVVRLPGVRELERLVADEVPPILSVSFDLLHGKSEDRGGGHLVVCAGFTKEGDFVLNDPWTRPGESVRRTVPRHQVLQAWARSRQTVYVIHPEGWAEGEAAQAVSPRARY